MISIGQGRLEPLDQIDQIGYESVHTHMYIYIYIFDHICVLYYIYIYMYILYIYTFIFTESKLSAEILRCFCLAGQTKWCKKRHGFGSTPSFWNGFGTLRHRLARCFRSEHSFVLYCAFPAEFLTSNTGLSTINVFCF
jgi:hypothetical protein